MKQKFTDFFQRNGFYVLAAVCVIALAAVIAVVSTDTNENTNPVAQNAAGFSDDETELESTEQTKADAAASSNALGTDNILDYTEGYNADEIQNIITQIEESEAQSDALESTAETAPEVAANAAAAPAYDGSSKLSWPINGEILMRYSMDTTTYFKTLDQYKCNEGLMIAAQTNTPVNCAFDGVVETIYATDEYGTCVCVNMGNDYKAIYGQLKDVNVTEGQMVSAGQQLACVAEPSKYFSKEGSHLFFELTQDGIPMNPENYLE